MGSGSSQPKSTTQAPRKVTTNQTERSPQNNNTAKAQQNKPKKPTTKGNNVKTETIGECINNIFNELESSPREQSPNNGDTSKVPDYYTEVETKWRHSETKDDADQNEIFQKELSINEGAKKKSAADEGKVKGDSVQWIPRRKEIQYEVTPSGGSERVVDDKIEFLAESNKRDIVVISGIHFGRDLPTTTGDKIKEFMDSLLEKASDEIHSVILLGDIFEMWIDPFQSVPKTTDQLMSFWKTNLCEYFVSCIKQMAGDYGVKVYYLRGNHDHEITASIVERIFGNCVTFIAGSLVYRMSDGVKEHRIRFMHGHEWNLYNSYALGDSDNLLCNKPIGHYISRAMASSATAQPKVVAHHLANSTTHFLSAVPESLENDLVTVLSQQDVHERFTKRLLDCVSLDAQCITEDGKYLSRKSMLSYPYIRLMCEQLGDKHVLNMLRASAGDYRCFVKQCNEDVVVLAHANEWCLHKYKANNGNDVIYVNTGSWINQSEFSSIRISPPKKSLKNGRIQVNHESSTEPITVTQPPTVEQPKREKEGEIDDLESEDIS